MQTWWVYLVKCADNTLYCGIAIDPVERTHHHNHTTKGASYTRSRRPVTLIWSEGNHTHSSALKREAQIKKFSRKQKIQLASSNETKDTNHA